jgi:hypothetical protein
MSDFTQADLTQIKRAIATGAKQAMIQGEMVQYRDLSEMRQIMAMIQNDLDGTTKVSTPILYPETSRGL